MSTAVTNTNISILEDLKRTGQLTFFNPSEYFNKGLPELEWTAEVHLEGDEPRYTFLRNGRNRFYDGHLYLDRTAIAPDKDKFCLFTFINGEYQELTSVEKVFDPSGTTKHWEETVKQEIIRLL